MISSVITLAHHVEEEGVRVIVQSFVIKKQFGEETEVLGVVLVLSSVNFKEGNGIFPIDFITRWIFVNTFCQMSFQTCPGFKELETELTNINALLIG